MALFPAFRSIYRIYLEQSPPCSLYLNDDTLHVVGENLKHLPIGLWHTITEDSCTEPKISTCTEG
jgi:hypothetical protein